MKYALIAAAVVIIIYLFLICPAISKSRIKRYRQVNFAHRGLFDKSCPENSLKAFRNAVDAGYGIELDVWVTADGELVVFHDGNTERMCGVNKKINQSTLSELKELRLLGSDEGIPTLSQVLCEVNGRVPLLIELKSDFSETDVCVPFLKAVEGYDNFIVESFNPFALSKIRKRNKKIPLGILSCDFSKSEGSGKKLVNFALKHLLLNFLYRPDFIAYGNFGKDSLSLKLISGICKTPVFRWTVHGIPEEGYGAIFERE